MYHVVVGRDEGCVESDPCPVGHEITPRGQTVVEMIGGGMSLASQHRRQQNRVIVKDPNQQRADYEILLRVENR